MGPNEEKVDQKEHGQGDPRGNEREARCNQVGNGTHQVPAAEPLHSFGGETLMQEPVSLCRVPPSHVHDDPKDKERRPIERGADGGVVSVSKGFCQNRGRERYEPDDHELQEVDQQRAVVHAHDVVVHLVVVQPNRPDGEEADRVGDIRGPQVQQTPGERGSRRWRLDLQDQQGNRDGEDRIAKEDQALGASVFHW